MTSFWPQGLEISDIQSPLEILQKAQVDWEESSDSLLTLVLQSAKSESGNDMIIVHAKHVPSKRTTVLFSVVHRANIPYPVTIQVKDENLPNSLRKTYYDPSFYDISKGLVNFAESVVRSPGKTVTNPWVAETPAEFRKKLGEAFNLGIVKSEVLSLVSSSSKLANGNE